MNISFTIYKTFSANIFTLKVTSKWLTEGNLNKSKEKSIIINKTNL